MGGRQPHRAARERRGVLPARVRCHSRGAARSHHRDLHPVRGQGRLGAACRHALGGPARREDRSAGRRLRLAGSLARIHLAAERRGRAGAGVRSGATRPRQAAQRVSADAPQDRGGRWRTRVRGRHQLFGRPPAGLRAQGQAGLRGGAARTRRGADPPVRAARHRARRQGAALVPPPAQAGAARRPRVRRRCGGGAHHARQPPPHQRHRTRVPGRDPRRTQAHRDCQRVFLSRLQAHQGAAPRCPARRGRAAHPARRARHADRQDGRHHALPPPAACGRAHLRILRPPAARQGRADGRRMDHGRLEQSRSAEPVAQPGGQRVCARQGLQPAAVGTHGQAHARELPADRRGRPGERMERLAAGAQLLHLPLPALVSVVARLAAAAGAAPHPGRDHRACREARKREGAGDNGATPTEAA